MYRQEQSRTALGVTYVKDLGNPLWQMSAQSKLLKVNTLDYWRAQLKTLENGLQTFYGYSMSRCYPILYKNGSWPLNSPPFDGVSAVLNTINANRKAITVAGLPPAFVLSVGDYIQIGTTDLHQVVESATASAGGLTPEFEIRPFLWSGVHTGSPTTLISVLKPHCIMAIVPGSIQTDASISGWGTVSFQAMEARS